jgi:DNA gyrase/topoisomerase IV subunit A
LEGNGDKVRGYTAGINALTIDDTHRLRTENMNLKQTLTEWAKNRQEMAQIRKELEEIRQQKHAAIGNN